MTRFGHEAVVFGAAFSDSGFASVGAQRHEIAGDGGEHRVDDGGDGAGFCVGSAGGVGELTDGIQSALEGNAVKSDIVNQSGFLHDATHEIVGNEMHEEFAFDQGR